MDESICLCGDTRARPILVDNDLGVCQCELQSNPIWISSDDDDNDAVNKHPSYHKTDIRLNRSDDDDSDDSDDGSHSTDNHLSGAIDRFGNEQKEPARELIFCLAMSWSHPTDRVRLLQLQKDDTLVVSVSSQTNVPGNHVDCDFKTDRGIDSILRYLHAAKQRESFCAVTLILDYFFLEKNYYQSNYGLRWLSSTGYRLLSQGMTQLLLPNDNGLDNRDGMGMHHMLQGRRHPALVVSYLPAANNPLWVASNDDSVTTECTYGKIRRLENRAATVHYLDKDHPFVSLTLSPLHNTSST